MFAEETQCFRDFFLGEVSVAIDEKEIFPGFPLAGARLDFGHVDAITAERREGAVKRTDTIDDAEHDAGAIVAGRGTALTAKDEKARCIGGVVLNVLLENWYAVFFGGEYSGNGCSIFFLCGKFG